MIKPTSQQWILLCTEVHCLKIRYSTYRRRRHLPKRLDCYGLVIIDIIESHMFKEGALVRVQPGTARRQISGEKGWFLARRPLKLMSWHRWQAAVDGRWDSQPWMVALQKQVLRTAIARATIAVAWLVVQSVSQRYTVDRCVRRSWEREKERARRMGWKRR